MDSEEEFRKHLDVKNMIPRVDLDISWDLKGKIIPTKIKFDKRLIKYDMVPEALKVNKNEADYHFSRCLWESLQWESDQIKINMLKNVKKVFNDEIDEIHIFKSGHINEPMTAIITHNNGSPIVWIKFLTKKIDDTVWKNYEESIAGKDAVIIK